MKDRIFNLWKEEDGAETAEWLLIAALLVAVGIAVYEGVLQPQLDAAATAIGTTITGAATP